MWKRSASYRKVPWGRGGPGDDILSRAGARSLPAIWIATPLASLLMGQTPIGIVRRQRYSAKEPRLQGQQPRPAEGIGTEAHQVPVGFRRPARSCLNDEAPESLPCLARMSIEAILRAEGAYLVLRVQALRGIPRRRLARTPIDSSPRLYSMSQNRHLYCKVEVTVLADELRL